MQTYIEKITPEIASAFLKSNSGNRPINRNHVKALSASMRSGEWMLTHQSIAISKSGKLLDGQHRLLAVIDSGFSVPMLIAVNVDEDSFYAMDCGKKRSIRYRTKLEPRLSDTASFLAEMIGGSDAKVLSAKRVINVAEVFASEHELLIQSCGSLRAKRSSAAIRAAATVRLACCQSTSDRAWILKQYRAFVNMQIFEMSAITGALLKKIDQFQGGSGGNLRRLFASYAWFAFNPANSNRDGFGKFNIEFHHGEMKSAAKIIFDSVSTDRI